MSTVIGIDLGTSTTEAAVIREGKPVMLLNFEQQEITPSAVGIDNSGNYVIGERAKAQYLLSPENTAIEIKRKIGTEERIQLGKRKYTPVELSAKLLEYVKNYASEYLDEEITRAVISVPAYFDDRQRQATVEAGNLAGFDVERIINEPTAAALSYGLEHMEEESHILVYDLGGGTFDVTLLEMFGGVLEVKASSGDNALGGKDFDERLIQWLVQQFQKKHGVDLRMNTYAMVKLKEKAEWCKKELSTQQSCQIVIPLIAESGGDPLSLEETVTAELFEKLIGDLVERTHHPIDVVMADSGILPSEIDRILLVGGSTRIPLIKRDIEQYLGKAPSASVNPDYAVAEGAAIQAGIIGGEIQGEDSLIMTDVNPYTLGIRALAYDSNDYMSVVIPRNVTIPVTRRETYSTSFDCQTMAKIMVYQGENQVASRNHFLGEFMIGDIPSGKAGQEAVEVEFSYNLNGILEVTAVILSTMKKASIEINMMNRQNEQEEEEIRTDVSGWKKASGAEEFRSIIRKVERILKKPEMNGKPLYREDLEKALYLLKKALLEEDMITAAAMEEELLDILEELQDGR
ncbi:MAG: Hsp70 family protein [Lachnospiraceae bacterium]|nr:Hsp70 family protein [Lachnospiraceae bacterium]